VILRRGYACQIAKWMQFVCTLVREGPFMKEMSCSIGQIHGSISILVEYTL